MPFEHRPAWMEIDIKALKHNYKTLKKAFGSTKICAVVKADAYGHGMVPVALGLYEEGVDFFAVATINEAVELRLALPKVDILILGYTPVEATTTLLQYNLIQTVYDHEQIQDFNQAAIDQKGLLKVHVKIDTGLRRLGFNPNGQTADYIKSYTEMAGICVDGVFSHFAKADELDATSAHKQGSAFKAFLSELSKRSVQVRFRHMCNSAAAAQFPEYHFDMVRPGIALYGQPPSDEVNLKAYGLKEVMCIKAEIAMVKQVAQGDGVSYGHRYHMPETLNVATIPLGYGDGFLRGLSGSAKVLVQGHPKPIIGSVAMDQCLVELGDLEAKMGDEIIVMGGNAHPEVSVDAFAKALGTISYEVTCLFSARLHRKIIV